ncbi:hypothetical protein H257_12235 [Aphanomyces astaci]|uniref:Uncharacterized protein n=1 Tax=Aphanomyces astaci TaxID=112090 RepID=W4FZJ6_APHAT|nr:hypothetical protein H257_12235 [Aphanomyces astaci]ETV72900.1 hypothetical protein H257_12235 [Aphanomyces astaci]|eukprot:XP_009837686.1 hypothetical protein H257_12235 [Aphanomyces astaci]
MAATKGHLDVMERLHANRSEGGSPCEFSGAAAARCLDGMQWLVTHRPDDNCFDEAMLAASGKVIGWLLSQVAIWSWPNSLMAMASHTPERWMWLHHAVIARARVASRLMCRRRLWTNPPRTAILELSNGFTNIDARAAPPRPWIVRLKKDISALCSGYIGTERKVVQPTL